MNLPLKLILGTLFTAVIGCFIVLILLIIDSTVISTEPVNVGIISKDYKAPHTAIQMIGSGTTRSTQIIQHPAEYIIYVQTEQDTLKCLIDPAEHQNARIGTSTTVLIGTGRIFNRPLCKGLY